MKPEQQPYRTDVDAERKIADLEAQIATWKEVADASSKSSANLAAYAQGDSQYDLPMSGPDTVTRDVIKLLRAEFEELRDTVDHWGEKPEACQEERNTELNHWEETAKEALGLLREMVDQCHVYVSAKPKAIAFLKDKASLVKSGTTDKVKCWPIDLACGPTSPFEYNQGDVVCVEYDDLYDLRDNYKKLWQAVVQAGGVAGPRPASLWNRWFRRQQQ